MEEENMKYKKNKKNRIFIIEIIIIALFLAFGSGFILRENLEKKDKKDSNKDIKAEEKSNDVDELSADEIEKLLGILPTRTPNTFSNEIFNVFQNKKITAKDVNNEILLEEGINHSFAKRNNSCTDEEFAANGICDFTVKVEDVKEIIKNMYDVEVEPLDTFMGSGLLKCTVVKDNYACSFTGGGWTASSLGIYFDTMNNYYVKYLSSKKENGYLYMYVGFVRYKFVGNVDSDATEIDKFNFKLYKNSNTDELLVNDTLYAKDFYEENSTKTFKEKIFDYLKDNTSNFVNVYKIGEDGSYTWVYTEPTN